MLKIYDGIYINMLPTILWSVSWIFSRQVFKCHGSSRRTSGVYIYQLVILPSGLVGLLNQHLHMYDDWDQRKKESRWLSEL